MNDSHETTAVHKNLWQESGIPPLDYCTIERASKLLNCEIDDIWHWYDRCYINFYVHVDYLDEVVGDSTFHITPNDVLTREMYYVLRQPSAHIRSIFPFDVYICDDFDNNNRLTLPRLDDPYFPPFFVYLPPLAEYDAKVFEQTGEHSLTARKTPLSGFLRVHGVLKRHYHPRECGEQYIRLYEQFKCAAFKFETKSEQIHLSHLADKNIYMAKDDLEDLYNAKVNGCFDYERIRQQNIEQMLRTANETKNGNNIAERHARNREELLKSAIYILSQYPDECRGKKKEISPEKWRDCIVAHKDEIPPLAITSEDVILRQLRAAANGKG